MKCEHCPFLRWVATGEEEIDYCSMFGSEFSPDPAEELLQYDGDGCIFTGRELRLMNKIDPVEWRGFIGYDCEHDAEDLERYERCQRYIRKCYERHKKK